MEIYVTDPAGEQFVGNTKEELTEELYRTATPDYTSKVLTWFDTEPHAAFKIKNGNDVETWHVI
jgi:hypothetical protein